MAIRTTQYDDTKHTPIWIAVGDPFVVNYLGTSHIQIAFNVTKPEDLSRAEQIISICKGLIEIGVEKIAPPEAHHD